MFVPQENPDSISMLLEATLQVTVLSSRRNNPTKSSSRRRLAAAGWITELDPDPRPLKSLSGGQILACVTSRRYFDASQAARQSYKNSVQPPIGDLRVTSTLMPCISARGFDERLKKKTSVILWRKATLLRVFLFSGCRATRFC